MLRRVQAIVAVLMVLVAPAALPAQAAERSISLMQGYDLPGADYQVLKGTTLDACEAACKGDSICRAFTFNTKAHWCFLKGAAGTPAPFADAVSGQVASAPSPEELAATREGELPFPASGLIGTARNFAAQLPKSDPAPKDASYADLVAEAEAAGREGNPAAAIVAYRQALGIVGNDPAVWLKLADAALVRLAANPKQARERDDLADLATSAALNAYLRSEPAPQQAQALARLARALEARSMWREAIASSRASLKLVADPALAKHLETVVAQHGFRVTDSKVDADAATPRICATFSEPLPVASSALSAYVVVAEAPQAAIDTDGSQLCVEGLDHGQRYHVRLRAGLPSAAGETLRKDVELNLFVPDRAPFVGFANNAYVLPSGLGGGLPISSVNAKTADIVVYRIGDRAIASAVRDSVFRQTLDANGAEDIANSSGEKLFEGEVDLNQAATNAEATTTIPVGDIVKQIRPGAYVITAKVHGSQQDYWAALATQWFIVTDLGLTTVSGDDGVHAFVRSLTTAEPVAGVTVRLVARNNDILGEATTDTDGEALFAPGLARGDGGKAPQVLTAETGDGDYAFLDVSRPGFDLTDRGVDGRPSPGPLDLFATTERGVYRPGETVYLTALLRDAHAVAVTDLPLTMEVGRPDGVVSSKTVLKDQGAGSYFEALPLAGGAMRGSWHVRLYADPKAPPLANVNFLVEDFEPERLAFDLSAPKGPMSPDEPTTIGIAARYLYGATAPDLAVEADAVLTPTRRLAGFPGYSFGRADDPAEPDREPLGVVATTDAAGKAEAEITLPQPPDTTRPIEAQLIFDLVDTNGRTVERTLSRPVRAAGDRIGVKPQFDAGDGVPAGAQAKFDVVTVSPDGKAVARTGLGWTLSRLNTRYQWYHDGSTWKWEAITTTTEVASGSLDTADGGPVTVSAPVDAGRYQIEVHQGGEQPASTSLDFYAGYYYVEAGTDTPDKLRVALDKPAYRAGDTAHLKLDPQFAGTALVMVVADRIIAMQAVDVPASGTTVAIPVTDDWSPGAYVTAMLYRPADTAQKRMPARALGLAFADVDPGDHKLALTLDAPAQAKPRQAFDASLTIGNLEPGAQAYVTVAAVDLGILNLTHFKVPDPDGWYFGQRRLGVEFRDLYGQLIDPNQGAPGAVRSGGDEGAQRLGTPPATSVLVALDSGIVTVGPDGKATVSFDMPDFNGTVRLMAMAWTKTAVGHASRDVVVHDPVVVNLSPPRFLRIGDKSRLLVEIDNVSGPAGHYSVALDTGEGLTSDAAETSFDFAEKARKALDLGLAGTIEDDNPLTVTVTGPDGLNLQKHLTIGVRAPAAAITRSEIVPLPAGGSVSLDAGRFTGLLAHSGALSLTVGALAEINVPELLAELNRYPYGCAEQLSSVAMPLLYLNDVAVKLGLGSDDALGKRVDDTIDDLFSKQTSSGGFGLWGPDDYATDLWLDAYVTDFLQRAAATGHKVPAERLGMALDHLANQVSAAADFEEGGEDIAYALYDLARAGRAAIGDLRYYYEARLDHFGSPLAKAQLGAALALYGDKTRAAGAFAAAVEGLQAPEDKRAYRGDYGSKLRDVAGVLTLAAEFRPAGVDLEALARQLGDLRALARFTSTQEDAWMLLAAAALSDSGATSGIAIDGKPVGGNVYERFMQERFASGPVVVANNGGTDTEMAVTVTGDPAEPPPAASNGFTITRSYYTPEGKAVDPARDPVRQNDRFVVVLSVTSNSLGSGQYVLTDPLPAGFEIENPDLTAGGGLGDMSWLKVDTPTHVEARTDRFVAAFRYGQQTPHFAAAYMVRAVSPGDFVQPGASIEDMYRPELRANTEGGHITIGRTGP